jgi:hypothetical protein
MKATLEKLNQTFRYLSETGAPDSELLNLNNAIEELKEVEESLECIIDYNVHDVEKDFKEMVEAGKPVGNHIYYHIKKVEDWIYPDEADDEANDSDDGE